MAEEQKITRLWMVHKKGLCYRMVAADDAEEAVDVYRTQAGWTEYERVIANKNDSWRILYVGVTCEKYRGRCVDLSLEEFSGLEFSDVIR